MAEPISTPQGVLRSIRIVHAIMFAAVFLIAFNGEQIAQNAGTPDRTFIIVISFLAVNEIVIALFFRKRFVIASTERLRTQPDDVNALKRWKSGSILVSVFCLTIALFGLVLRAVGSPFSQCLPFYVMAAVLLLLWWPRLDLD